MMSRRINNPAAFDAQHLERSSYVAGWWWGFASGLICGTGSATLLGLLAYTLWQALACAAC